MPSTKVGRQSYTKTSWGLTVSLSQRMRRLVGTDRVGRSKSVEPRDVANAGKTAPISGGVGTPRELESLDSLEGFLQFILDLSFDLPTCRAHYFPGPAGHAATLAGHDAPEGLHLAFRSGSVESPDLRQ